MLGWRELKLIKLKIFFCHSENFDGYSAVVVVVVVVVVVDEPLTFFFPFFFSVSKLDGHLNWGLTPNDEWVSYMQKSALRSLRYFVRKGHPTESWKKPCTSFIGSLSCYLQGFYSFFYIPDGAGFLPSTVCILLHGKYRISSHEMQLGMAPITHNGYVQSLDDKSFTFVTYHGGGWLNNQMAENCKMQHKLAVFSFLISTIGEKGGLISDLQLQSFEISVLQWKAVCFHSCLKIFMQCQTLTSCKSLGFVEGSGWRGGTVCI